jgi:hypothetical protein
MTNTSRPGSLLDTLHLVTLTTGHVTSILRSEFSEEVIQAHSLWLERSIRPHQEETLASPSATPCFADVGAAESQLFVGVYTRPPQPNTEPVDVFSVACTAIPSPLHWKVLVRLFGRVGGLQEPPYPWCAIALHHPHPLLDDPEFMSWIHELAQAAGWFWVDRQRRTRVFGPGVPNPWIAPTS